MLTLQPSYCAHDEITLGSRCAHTVLTLCSRCAHTVPHRALTLCSHCAHTVSHCAQEHKQSSPYVWQVGVTNDMGDPINPRFSSAAPLDQPSLRTQTTSLRIRFCVLTVLLYCVLCSCAVLALLSLQLCCLPHSALQQCA
jgi:hypothetical protein